MIVKKLAVPLINEKILQQAVHCYIATAAISEAAFDFVKSRIPTTCKIEMVTGLDVPTSPMVLRRIWRHYQDRITLTLHTKNFFHPNVYVFDLPYRKSVAFIGSGHFTLEGLKDHEEIFYKLTEPKQVEACMSWFTSYYQFGEPLTEAMIQEYERIYPSLKQRELTSRLQKRDFIELTTRGFNWENFKFKNQYFQKEDYVIFALDKASADTSEVQEARRVVKNKLLQLHEAIKGHISTLKLHYNKNTDELVNLNSIDPHTSSVHSMSISYGRRDTELNRYYPKAKLQNFLRLQIIMRQKEMGIWLVIGHYLESKEDRAYFQGKMNEPEYRTQFFKSLIALGKEYWIEIAGERKGVELFQHETGLWEFTKTDDWKYTNFVIGRNFSPGALEISNDKIISTMTQGIERLLPLYNQMKDQLNDG